MTMLRLDRKLPPYTGGGMSNYISHYKLDFTPEEIYLIHNNLQEPPKCKYCGKNCEFISYFKGYRDRCSSKECVEKSSKEGVLKSVVILQEKRKEYVEYVKKNIDFYKNLNFPSVDIFDGKPIKNLSAFRRKLGGQINIFDEERTCIICKQKYTYNRFTWNKCYCSSKGCVNVAKAVKYDINEYVPYSNEIDFDIFHLNKKRKTFTNDELLKFYNKYGRDKVILLIKRLAIEYNSYFLVRKNTKDLFSFRYNGIILDEMKNKCVVCGKEYIKFDIKIHLDKNYNMSVSKKKIGSLYTCRNKKCYYKAKTMGFEEYKESTEDRKKQSQIMREKIKNGTFTPCVTNSYTSRAELKFDDIAFRSTWELYFYIFQKENGVLLNYEKVRIPYFDSETKTERTYIVDFNSDKFLYEIKPEENLKDQNVIDKELYTKKYCLKNDLKYIIISNKWFREHYDPKLLNVLPDVQKERCIKLLKQFEDRK